MTGGELLTCRVSASGIELEGKELASVIKVGHALLGENWRNGRALTIRTRRVEWGCVRERVMAAMSLFWHHWEKKKVLMVREMGHRVH